MSNDLKAKPAQPAKRKHQDSEKSAEQKTHEQKRARFEHGSKQRDARAIAAQASMKAFKHGQVDVDKFVKSREYEIQALERGLINSKKALSKRAFQLVPKDLRRRTASHNVQRVPKRLRARARKEMKEDNTPIVTAKKRRLTGHMRLRLDTAKKLHKLSREKPSVEGSQVKVKVRKAKKLPTLAEAPTIKVKFRKRQKDKAWLPTHLFHAKRARMTPPSQPLWRFAIPLTPNAKSYRSTHRTTSSKGAMAWDASYYSTIQLTGRRSSLKNLLQSLGIENQLVSVRKQHLRAWMLGRQAIELLAYHRDQPSRLIAPVTFLWAQSAKTGDEGQAQLWLRVHPAAFLQLWEEVLKLSKIAKPYVTVLDLRYEIGSVEVIGQEAVDALLAVLWPSQRAQRAALCRSLRVGESSSGAVFSFDINDPRLHWPVRTIGKYTSADGEASEETLPASEDSIFQQTRRVKACSAMSSQKSIERRRRAAPPGQLPQKKDGDPEVPVLLYVSSERRGSKHLNRWTMLLPWKWVNVVWYCLMHSPLPSGGQPTFGGLDERRTLELEHGLASFPADFPASDAGWAWELQQRQRGHEDWKKRPKSKRVNWDTLAVSADKKGEHGLGWACDWHKLLTGASTEQTAPHDLAMPAGMRHVDHFDAEPLPVELTNALITVRIEGLRRGVPRIGARVYRLPAAAAERKRWLEMHPVPAPRPVIQRDLARSLLQPEEEYPQCVEEDLIGFVTSGNYDLGLGRGLAIGSLSVRLVRERWRASGELDHLCIVRNAGHKVGRLAKWSAL